MVCLISFSKFSDMLQAFTCASAIGNFLSLYVGINIINSFPCVFIGNIHFLKALRVNSQPSQRAYALL